METILHVQGLKTYFFTHRGTVKAVDGVSFKMRKGEALGLVGETGCGKTVTALSVMRLIPEGGRIVDGKIIFKGNNLLSSSHEFMRRIRGKGISMIFQEPMTALNTVFTIGSQLIDISKLDEKTEEDARARAIKMLKVVGLPNTETKLKQYPHELSGGMQQRAMIAMAIIRNPSLLIADEPTTSLDVTIQSQILKLIRELQKKGGTSILYISHNLGVIAETCDKVAVMYAGKIVEYAPVRELFKNPKHPYTRGLFASIPRHGVRTKRLHIIKGDVANMINPPSGCRFHPRCEQTVDLCTLNEPELIDLGEEHLVACHLHKEESCDARKHIGSKGSGEVFSH